MDARLARYHKLVVHKDGESLGRDPRSISAVEWEEAGIGARPLLHAIRDKCLECCVGNDAEVRKCAAIDCALWPYRMRKNPFHKRTDVARLSNNLAFARGKTRNPA